MLSDNFLLCNTVILTVNSQFKKLNKTVVQWKQYQQNKQAAE